jgi:hypothetical protein
MDPITLFAMANAAVSAVKKGCQLYKDIKGAAGDVKSVLKDLDEQFANNHKDKPATVAQRNAYIEEKNRVIELNKKQGETAGIYQELTNHLGNYFDNMYKCIAVLEEEERKDREEIYEGDDSLGRRALQRVVMKKQLEQMTVELREMMIYQSPPELGALWTDVSEMMKEMGSQQKVLIARKMQKEARIAARRKARLKMYMEEITYTFFIFIIAITMTLLFWWITYDRKQRWPELEPSVIKANQQERRRLHLLELQQIEEQIKKQDEEFKRESGSE